MKDESAVSALAALAHSDRLAAFRMLVRAGPNGMHRAKSPKRLRFRQRA